jgi:L-fucose mutarotase
MIRSKLIHPQIMGALAGSGHGSMVVLVDGNYPASTHSNPTAQRVYLNLMPGLVSVTQALEAVLSAVPVEAAGVMEPYDKSEPPIFGEFRSMLPDGMELVKHPRFDFYAAASQPEVALVVATGEQRHWANIILTIGVLPPS